ncbi:MAG TPA: tetratricopeptide repeat protein, partial [Terracidiphilus sp.]|nr:tetratricopeptide repeat protein [Terracidiphilus sp.]
MERRSGWALAVLLALACRGAAAQTHRAQQSPAQFDALAKRAAEAREAGRADDAAKLYKRALALNPKWSEGWWSLGTLDYDADRFAEAQLEFEKVVALDPKQGTARAMLGLCEFEQGQAEKALKDIEAAKALGVLENTQLRDVVLYHEGLLLQRAGQFEGAKAALASLCLEGVRSGELAGAFGLVALRMRDAVPPSSTTEAGMVVQHVGRGACLSGAKQYEAAKTEFENVLRRAPHYPLVHYAYGRVL